MRRGHIVAKCRSNLKCAICGCRHNVSICEENTTQGEFKTEDNTKECASSDWKSDKQEPQGSIQALCSGARSILMKTARANVYSLKKRERLESIRIVFDDGSHRTFITDQLRNALRFKTKGKKGLRRSQFMEGDEDSGEDESKNYGKLYHVVQLGVEEINEEDVVVTAYSVPTICPSPHSISIDICKNEFLHFS